MFLCLVGLCFIFCEAQKPAKQITVGVSAKVYYAQQMLKIGDIPITKDLDTTDLDSLSIGCKVTYELEGKSYIVDSFEATFGHFYNPPYGMIEAAKSRNGGFGALHLFKTLGPGDYFRFYWIYITIDGNAIRMPNYGAKIMP